MGPIAIEPIEARRASPSPERPGAPSKLAEQTLDAVGRSSRQPRRVVDRDGFLPERRILAEQVRTAQVVDRKERVPFQLIGEKHVVRESLAQ